MSQKTVTQINEEVVAFLLEEHFNAREKNKAFYFLLMQGPQRSFLEGPLPFRTTDDMVSLSFWVCSDNSSGPYRLQLNIYTEGKIEFKALIDKDSLSREDIEELWDSISGLEHASLNDTLLHHIYTQDHKGDFISYLRQFIQTDKKAIDIWVQKLSASRQRKVVDYPVPVPTPTPVPLTAFDTNQLFATMIRAEQFDKMLQQYLLFPREEHIQDYKKNTSGMPTGLAGFSIRNFRGIKRADIRGLSNKVKWIFITGENGFGKTSVLQAITIGFWGLQDEGQSLLDKESEDPVILVKTWDDYFVINAYASQYAHSKNTKYETLFPLVAYGSSRLLNEGKISSNKDRLTEGAVLSLFSAKKNLLNIENELIQANVYNKQYYDLLCLPFYALIPSLHAIQVNTNSRSPYIEYIEKGSNGETYQPLQLNQLAAGYRNMLNFVGDMVLRLSATLSTFTSLADLKGIVVIDELELHLHPKLQRDLPRKLSELFPNVQFIASTHSPIPLLGAPPESVVLTVHRPENEGINVEKMDVDFSKLLPNAILTSPIFGFEEMIPEAASGAGEVYTADSYDKVQLLKEMEEQLGIVRSRLNDNQ